MMRTWVPLPTLWIENRGLNHFSWKDAGSDAIAALICLVVIAHHTDNSGLARLTYDRINTMAGLSRAKISAGLAILDGAGLIGKLDRSIFQLAHLNTRVRGWGMLPAKGLYNSSGNVPFFKNLHLRSRTELDAMKIYLLFVARRDIERNRIDLSFDKIKEYSGVSRKKIPAALSLLAVNDLIRSERQRSDINDYATSNFYRLSFLDSYRHGGTFGRADLERELLENQIS